MFEKFAILKLIFVINLLLRHSNKGVYLAMSIVRRLSEYSIGSKSSFLRRVATNVAWEFQEDAAMIANSQRCAFCGWVIYPGESHPPCEAELASRHHNEDLPDADDLYDLEEEYEPRQVFLTEPPSGHNIYE